MSSIQFATLKRALIAASAVAAFPMAAFAGHFYIVHPSSFIPSVEAVLFWAAPDACQRTKAPSSEEYLFDQFSD
jgi:hypothetical protein